MSLNANDAQEIVQESGIITSHWKSIVIPLWEVSLEKSGADGKVATWDRAGGGEMIGPGPPLRQSSAIISVIGSSINYAPSSWCGLLFLFPTGSRLYPFFFNKWKSRYYCSFPSVMIPFITSQFTPLADANASTRDSCLRWDTQSNSCCPLKKGGFKKKKTESMWDVFLPRHLPSSIIHSLGHLN